MSRYKATFAQLRFLIEQRSDHWWVRVSDIDRPGILFQDKTATLEDAKARAAQFALDHLAPEIEGEEEEFPKEIEWTAAEGESAPK